MIRSAFDLIEVWQGDDGLWRAAFPGIPQTSIAMDSETARYRCVIRSRDELTAMRRRGELEHFVSHMVTAQVRPRR